MIQPRRCNVCASRLTPAPGCPACGYDPSRLVPGPVSVAIVPAARVAYTAIGGEPIRLRDSAIGLAHHDREAERSAIEGCAMLAISGISFVAAAIAVAIVIAWLVGWAR